MKNELLHGDLCPLYRRPLTLRKTVEVRSHQSLHPTRISTVPHCNDCASDMSRAQEWADLMRVRYVS
ncbi:hypothetical protein C3488_39485 [Streptomyces sp. Ru72]|nr:hypothetical protein C3488_39485 [Streptomyces sp. Ru72]